MRGRWQRSVKSKQHGNWQQLFSVSSKTRARGHQMKHGGDGFKTNKGKLFFIQCIIKPWNSLPQDVVDAVNLHGFKKNWTSSWKKNSPELLNTKTLPPAPEDTEMQISRCWESALRKSHFAFSLFPKQVLTVGPCQEEVDMLDGSFYSWYNSFYVLISYSCLIQGADQVMATDGHAIHILMLFTSVGKKAVQITISVLNI